jgi:hypothetical protein
MPPSAVRPVVYLREEFPRSETINLASVCVPRATRSPSGPVAACFSPKSRHATACFLYAPFSAGDSRRRTPSRTRSIHAMAIRSAPANEPNLRTLPANPRVSLRERRSGATRCRGSSCRPRSGGPYRRGLWFVTWKEPVLDQLKRPTTVRHACLVGLCGGGPRSGRRPAALRATIERHG